MKQLGIFDHIFVLSAAALGEVWGKQAFDAVIDINITVRTEA
jgi:hypothetical protein